MPTHNGTMAASVTLNCVTGPHNKFYILTAYVLPDHRFVVEAHYGRKGTAGKVANKTPTPVSRAKAELLLEGLVAEKKRRGYKEVSRIAWQSNGSGPATDAAVATDKPRRGSLSAILGTGYGI